MAGFEPAHGGSRSRCLIPWQHPSICQPRSSQIMDDFIIAPLLAQWTEVPKHKQMRNHGLRICSENTFACAVDACSNTSQTVRCSTPMPQCAVRNTDSFCPAVPGNASTPPSPPQLSRSVSMVMARHAPCLWQPDQMHCIRRALPHHTPAHEAARLALKQGHSAPYP